MLKPEEGGVKGFPFSLLSQSLAPGCTLCTLPCKFPLPAPITWFWRQGRCALWWVFSGNSATGRSWEPGRGSRALSTPRPRSSARRATDHLRVTHRAAEGVDGPELASVDRRSGSHKAPKVESSPAVGYVLAWEGDRRGLSHHLSHRVGQDTHSRPHVRIPILCLPQPSCTRLEGQLPCGNASKG